jgi:hypothetical protein
MIRIFGGCTALKGTVRGANARHEDQYFACNSDDEWFGPGPAALKD